MDASIGVNLRVTAHSNQGGRKYMEDMFCVAYQPTADEKDLLYAYFGIFDGHGGREAALYAKTHLMDHIVSQKNFWSEDDELVLRSIKDGFISVHQAMWRELDKWPKTQSGLPSTSGTTASVAFVRRGKLYIGHVGDSGIVLGYQDPNSNFWKAKPLTMDHKPENPVENARIQECGGKVVSKSGVPRVVWNRPRLGHKGPVRRSTLIDEIPFLAVARSLGDLWSYNSEQNEFVVSPVPDTAVIEIDVNAHRCLILGSDGLWNMLSSQDAVNSVYFAEKNNERQNQLAAQLAQEGSQSQKNWINPSKRLVDRALDRWYSHNLRADNTSVVTVVIDPPGPPRVQKPPSPRHSSSSSSISSERSSPVSRLSCAQTNNHGMSPSPRFQRPIATTKFASKERHSPPRVHSPSHNHVNNQPQHARPESSSSQLQQQPGRSSGGKPIAGSSLAKMKATTSASKNINRPRQQRQPRDLPTRGTRSHPVLCSKTSRVVHVRTPTTPIASSSAAVTPSNQRTAGSPSSSIVSPVTSPDVSSDTVNSSDDQVQIHEISSSCEESWRSESSDFDESVQASSTEATETKGKKRGTNKRIQLPRAATTHAAVASSSRLKGRKRVSRQSQGEETEDGCSTVSPIKVIRLSSTGADEGRSSSKRTESQRLVDSQLQEAVGKLRNRTRDIRSSIQGVRKSPLAAATSPSTTPQVESSALVKSKGKKQRVGLPVQKTSRELPTTSSRFRASVTKTSLRTIQPIIPEASSEQDSSGAKTVNVSSTGGSRTKTRRSLPVGIKPLNQKNVRAVPAVSKAGPRITSLRMSRAVVDAGAVCSLVNTISLQNVTLKKAKPALKRLQQGKKMQPSSTTAKGISLISKRGAGGRKNVSRPSTSLKDSVKTTDASEGRSLRSGDVRPRLTRSRSTSRK